MKVTLSASGLHPSLSPLRPPLCPPLRLERADHRPAMGAGPFSNSREAVVITPAIPPPSPWKLAPPTGRPVATPPQHVATPPQPVATPPQPVATPPPSVATPELGEEVVVDGKVASLVRSSAGCVVGPSPPTSALHPGSVASHRHALTPQGTSQLDGPTPDNSFGFKVSQSALRGSQQDAHDVRSH